MHIASTQVVTFLYLNNHSHDDKSMNVKLFNDHLLITGSISLSTNLFMKITHKD